MPEDNELERSFKEHSDKLSCSNTLKVPFDMRCDFVKSTEACQKFGHINYIMFLECGPMRDTRFEEVMACVGLAVIFVYYLLCVAIVADQFPALKAMAKKMHMSEHLAGVTLLAFGNSTSDILGHIQNSPLGILFTFMMANAIFITLISGGLVCLLWPTQLPKYETVRTLLFFLLGVMTAEYFFLTGNYFSRGECAGILSIYIVYLSIEIIEGYLEKSAANKALNIVETRSRATVTRDTMLRRVTITSIGSKERAERNTVNTNATRLVDYRAANPKNEFLFADFVETMQPIDPDFWRNSGNAVRIALIMLSPLMLIFLLVIPMVNLERRRHGWSKLLNSVQIVITPFYVSCIFLDIQGLIIYYQLCVTVPLAVLVFQNSRTDIPPPFHFGFVILSTVGCIAMLYVCTTEMEEILQVVGMIIGLSSDFLAATISCWGASICTIIINVILAQHGYAAMAIAASYAGPFFSFIMSIGGLPLYRHITQTYATSHSSYYLTAYIFLVISLSSSLIWSLLFNFYGRRSVGIYNILIYILYIIYCVLCEKEIIHSYAIERVIEVV
ncbi:hypothetical protein ACLKA6_006245 [Drosophila palustris]